MSRCDANARESEEATRVVYTRTGQLWLCEAHWLVNEKALTAEGYLIVPVMPEGES
jgi:hypothetical protein